MEGRSARGYPDTSELIQRLWNYGAWARQDPGAPDNSCENPLYANFIPSKAWDEAWGEQVSADPGHEQEVDEVDAERMECWVLQLTRDHRAIIVRRFVLRQRVPWHEVDPAVRAIADLIEANWSVVGELRGKV